MTSAGRAWSLFQLLPCFLSLGSAFFCIRPIFSCLIGTVFLQAFVQIPFSLITPTRPLCPGTRMARLQGLYEVLASYENDGA